MQIRGHGVFVVHVLPLQYVSVIDRLEEIVCIHSSKSIQPINEQLYYSQCLPLCTIVTSRLHHCTQVNNGATTLQLNDSEVIQKVYMWWLQQLPPICRLSDSVGPV